MELADVKGELWGSNPVSSLSSHELTIAREKLLHWCKKNRVEVMEEIAEYYEDAYMYYQSLDDRDFMELYSPVFFLIEEERKKRGILMIDNPKSLIKERNSTGKSTAKRREN